jgi:hypothetical protein
MLDTGFKMMLLAAECQQVIGLRVAQAVFGGAAAGEEAQLMWSEKIEAAWRHGPQLMAGGSVDAMVDAYRVIVKANVARLSEGV